MLISFGARVSIGQSIVTKPRVLFLDEPTVSTGPH